MHYSRYSLPAALSALLLLIACAEGPSAGDLGYLQGYWEIRQVVFPDGSSRRYEVNPAVEYLSWDGQTGYRKKVQPTLEGRYLTSDDALPMQVLWREGRMFLVFSGEEDPWEEEVLELSSRALVTRHSNGLRYEYTRYEPIFPPASHG